MKVLIANRGEIAVRVIRACREAGWRTAAVYSDCDRDAPHVRLADEAWHIGGNLPAQSYLNTDRILDVARRSGAAFLHPGYGFLAENADFAEACRDAGFTFIGPEPQTIRQMGDKASARRVAVEAGVRVVAGTPEPFGEQAPDDALMEAADRVGFPLLVKAVAGGGGKGMRTVHRAEELVSAVRAARSEARSAFGDGTVYFERRLVNARHIEVQVMGDTYGNVVPFVERECSIQRRHQKLVEESPSPVFTRAQRQAIADAAARIARRAGYVNAGTIEFLVDDSGAFHFLEMNTRLQVEHPVTEAVTGVDLVRWQLRIARGERLDLAADKMLVPRGHAIECRVYAEDPDRGFLPSPGVIQALRVPSGPGVRDDSGVAVGFEIPLFYDSMMSKLIVWGETRGEAVDRLARALDEYRVAGVTTTIPFFRWLVAQPDFREGRFHTGYLDAVLAASDRAPFQSASKSDVQDAVVAAALSLYLAPRRGAAQLQEAPPGGWQRAARLEGLR
jgi:acetyl-CoA carboxylase biotin carboxylase subunit